MKKQISPKIVSLTFGVLVVCFAMAFYVLGWTEPTQTPPEGNVLAPLNVGPTGQSKAGGLILNTGGAVNGLIVDKGSVGIGTTNPSQKLDVAGQIHATGDICTDQGGGVCLSTGGGGGTIKWVWVYSGDNPSQTITVPAGITKLIIQPTAYLSVNLPADHGLGVEATFYQNGVEYARLREAASNNNGGYAEIWASTQGIINVTPGSTINLSANKSLYNYINNLCATGSWTASVICGWTLKLNATFVNYVIYGM